MKRINYNQLFYFYVVATEGSVKAACKKLHLTQPTISGQLKTLEEDLGFQLFDRKHRRLELNEQGKEVLKRAEKIFILGEELLVNLPGESNSYRQEVRIGAMSSLPNSFLHDFTMSIWKDSTISAHITHASLSELIKSLDNGQLDLILANSPYQRGKKYHSINLGSHGLIAVGAKKFAGLKRGFPRSLDQVPYLPFSANNQLQAEIDFFLDSNNIRPDRLGSVDDAMFIRQAAEHGMCVAILPELTVRGALKSKALVRLGEVQQVTTNAWAITSSRGHKRVVLRKLINNYQVLARRQRR